MTWSCEKSNALIPTIDEIWLSWDEGVLLV